MKKFVVIYHAPADVAEQMEGATEEQKMDAMKPWLAWKARVGENMVDFGAPLSVGHKLSPDGSTQVSTKGVSGYSILQADNLDEAKRLLDDHPHLQWIDGCDIEVHECIPM